MIIQAGFTHSWTSIWVFHKWFGAKLSCLLWSTYSLLVIGLFCLNYGCTVHSKLLQNVMQLSELPIEMWMPLAVAVFLAYAIHAFCIMIAAIIFKFFRKCDISVSPSLLQEAQWHSRHRQQYKERRSAPLLVSPSRSASLLSAYSRSGPPDHTQSSVQVHCTVHLYHWAAQLTGHRLSHQDIAHV